MISGVDLRPSRAIAVSVPYSVNFEDCLFMRERILAVRDTLIVFGLQVVFRVTMILRHLNY